MQARQAKKYIRVNNLNEDALLNIALVVAIVSISFTSLLISLAVSVALKQLA